MEKNMDKCGLLKSFWTNQIINNKFDNLLADNWTKLK